ncbi:tail assembly protein [Methylobacterium sp. CM6247]
MQLESAPNTIQVLALPHVLDPTRDRVELTVLPGQTLAEMAAEALPLARQLGADYLRIYINGHVVEAENWHRVRAKAGMHVLIRAIPQGDVFKNVLLIALSVAAIAAGQFYAPELLGLLSIGVNTATSAAATFAISSPILREGRLLWDAMGAHDCRHAIPALQAEQHVRAGVTPHLYQ